MLEEKDDDRIRCCHHCMDTLLKRQQKLEEKDNVPDIVKLYEVTRTAGLPPGEEVAGHSWIFSPWERGFHSVVHFVVNFLSFPFGVLASVSWHSPSLTLSPLQRLRLCMDKVDEKAPEYIRMAESLK